VMYSRKPFQCLCLPPEQWQPQEPAPLAHEGASAPLPSEEAKTESFLESRVEPQWGHLAPFQLLERTSTSLSLSHFSQ
jgi:hypothetical protein